MRTTAPTGKLASLALIAGLSAAPNLAGATGVHYYYVGRKYTHTDPAGGCLTTLMHLSVTVTLPTALPPGQTNLSVTPTSWTISNGLHTYKSTPTNPAAILKVSFSTNATGAITDWNIYSVYYFPNSADFTEYSTLSSWDHTHKIGGDASTDYTCTSSVFTPEDASNVVPGHWTKN